MTRDGQNTRKASFKKDRDWSAWGGLVGVALSQWVPIQDPTLRTMIAMQLGIQLMPLLATISDFAQQMIWTCVGQLAVSFGRRWSWFHWFSIYFRGHGIDYTLVVPNRFGKNIYPGENKWFDYLERFLFDHHANQIQLATSTNAGHQFSKKSSPLSCIADSIDSLEIQWRQHLIQIATQPCPEERSTVTDATTEFLLSSSTANTKTLGEFLKSLSVQEQTSWGHPGMINYRSMMRSRHEIFWSMRSLPTNKVLNKNTFLTPEVNQFLVERIDEFTKNASWDQSRGLPHKIGFLLYGPPGTGKTSTILAIAREHELPVFDLPLSRLRSDDDLQQLIEGIEKCVDIGKENYIILIEDIDRYLTQTPAERFGMNPTSKTEQHLQTDIPTGVSFEYLLQFLDGADRHEGRILCITSNDPHIFDDERCIMKMTTSHSFGEKPTGQATQNDTTKESQSKESTRTMNALIRPGRVDHEVKFGFCTKEQAHQIIKMFYSDTMTPTQLDELQFPDLSTTVPFTTAELIACIRLNHDDIAHALNFLKNLQIRDMFCQ